jgi:hypothetical protein
MFFSFGFFNNSSSFLFRFNSHRNSAPAVNLFPYTLREGIPWQPSCYVLPPIRSFAAPFFLSDRLLLLLLLLPMPIPHHFPNLPFTTHSPAFFSPTAPPATPAAQSFQFHTSDQNQTTNNSPPSCWCCSLETTTTTTTKQPSKTPSCSLLLVAADHWLLLKGAGTEERKQKHKGKDLRHTHTHTHTLSLSLSLSLSLRDKDRQTIHRSQPTGGAHQEQDR